MAAAVGLGAVAAPVIAANIVSTDLLLVFFETAAMFAFVEGWSREGAAARRWYVLMWLAWGLAFMTKGPPGLLPLLAMIVYPRACTTARGCARCSPARPAAVRGRGIHVVRLVDRPGPDRLRYFLGYEVYDRVFTDVHDRNAEWYGAFKVYCRCCCWARCRGADWRSCRRRPARGLASAARRGCGARPRLAAARYWFLLPLAVFFLARSRLQLYVLPLFVPLALMLARPLAHWQLARRPTGCWHASLVTAVAWSR